MKATKIYYEELRTFDKYNNRKVGIELQIEDGEAAADVLQKAKLFVQSSLASQSLNAALLESFVRKVKSTQDALVELNDKVKDTLPLDDDIPF